MPLRSVISETRIQQSHRTLRTAAHSPFAVFPFALAMAAVRFLFLLVSSLFPLSLSLSEIQALRKLKQSFNNSDALNSWDSDSSPCHGRWAGIICNNGIITGLHLSDLCLSGEIDIEAIRELRGLRTVSLVNNSFSGEIPEFNRIGALKALLLSSNGFSGVIPTGFFSNLTSLKKVWFSGNQFSGKIPNSLGKLSHLIELHLESNKFSGEIPNLKQKSITSLDLSNNKLEGEIPSGLSRFNPKSFEQNEGLCGKPLNKTCKVVETAFTQSAMAAPQPEQSSNLKHIVVGALIAVIVVFFAFLAISSSRGLDDDFSVLGKEQRNNTVELHLPSTLQKANESTRRGDSKRGSQSGRNGIGDLVVINADKGGFGMADLMKASAEVLGNGGLGSAYKAVMSNGLSVVVKRMREVNRIGKDSFDAEMRRFGRLRHRNILTPVAYHYRREEKLLVSEYIPKGSLLYVLHGDRGISHSDLNWPTRLKIIKGIARGLGFIHSEFSTYDLPHGNLKSSNVLLSEDYEPLLNDYAVHPLINPSNAAQAMFAYKSPEYTQYQEISPKSDVYCLGILILEILTGKFPSQYLSTVNGGTDVVQWTLSALAEKREAEALDPEIAGDADSPSIEQMLQLLRVGSSCTQNIPHQRPEMREAIRMIEEIQI